MQYFLLSIILSFMCLTTYAQEPSAQPRGSRGNPVNTVTDRARGLSNIGRGSGSQKDSLKKRDKLADSITISYRYKNDAKRYKLDSLVTDFTRFPSQPNYITLGNTGAPTKPILFTPITIAGFDAGKHSFDAYRWTMQQAKFYKTTRPYTELAYVIGSKAEQTIQLTHTQNIKPDWNIAFDYRLINAPGYFRNQKTNHNNLLLNSYYQGKKKRYANWFVILNNAMQNSDYGGVLYDSTLNDPTFKDRAQIQTKLNNNVFSTRNPFNNKLESGQLEKERIIALSQSYDFGKKDSIAINDSTTQYLFYAKLRIEHTLTLTKQSFLYRGLQVDSSFYKTNYSSTDSIFTKSGFDVEDAWNMVRNDFSVYQFPDTKNSLQYLKAGITFESIKGTFKESIYRTTNRNFNNLFVHFTYKNRTKNKQWDMDANASLYLNGYNSGDYEANATLIRLTNTKLGNLKLQFQNVNRTPSFIYYTESAFNYGALVSLKKENHLQLTAQAYNDKKLQSITAQLLVSNNLTTWQTAKLYRQENLFNLLKISFARTFKVYRKIVLHTEATFQQVIVGNPNINLPTLYTRNRIAYEGNFGKKNLRLATGLELRYIVPYKLDAWSPLNSQFYYQNTVSSKKNLPDINAYLHFNITSFSAFVRIENLNTARIRTTGINPGLTFTNNNLAAVGYPNPGMVFRLGIYWRFVN